MAQFDIDLALKVTGQERLANAKTAIGQLNRMAQTLKPINLFAPGGGKVGDGIRMAMKPLRQFAREAQNANATYSKTVDGAIAQARTFEKILRNVKVEAGGYSKQVSEVKGFADALAQATVQAELLERNLEELTEARILAERQQAGLAIGPASPIAQGPSGQFGPVTLEDDLRRIALKNDLLEEETRIRRANAKEIKRQASEQKRKNDQDERETKSRRQNRLRDITAGIGFPILFGGGPGAIAGGALGALGGFGPSILLSAIGTQLDKLGVAAMGLGKALVQPTQNLEQLVASLGKAGRDFKVQASLLTDLGLDSVAALQARKNFEAIYGTETLKKLDDLGFASRDFTDSLAELGVRLTAFVSGPLGQFLKAMSLQMGSGTAQGQLAELAQPIALLEGELAGAENARDEAKDLADRGKFADQILRINEKLIPLKARQKSLQESINAGTKEEATTAEIIKSRYKAITDLAKERTKVEKITLTARRDTLAAEQADLAIKENANKLDIARQNLQAQTDLKEKGDKKEIARLTNQIGELEEKDRQLKARKGNAITSAQRAILKDNLNLIIEQRDRTIESAQASNMLLRTAKGANTVYHQDIDLIYERLKADKENLRDRERIEKIGVTENEILEKITAKYKLLNDLASQRADQAALVRRQEEAAYQLAQQRFQQERSTAALQAQIEADQQIRQMDPARSFGFFSQGMGFFGGSFEMQANQALAYEEQLMSLNKQLTDTNANLQIFALAPQVREGLEQQRTRIEDSIKSFQRYQPEIDKAALFQQRFNDALALTAPVTDSITESLSAVIDGTQTAQQAFANFLQSIADMLADVAKQMIAQYIAIGIARMFANVPGTSSNGMFGAGAPTQTFAGEGIFTGAGPFQFGGGMASGGRVSGGTSYLVGEKGSELFTPGASGTITPNHAMGGMASNIVVNVDASGSSVEGRGDDQKRLGEAIGIAVRQELIKQQRPGGLLA